MPTNPIFDKLEIKPEFESSYKDYVFWAWYDNGKPDMVHLLTMLEANIDGNRPSEATLRTWLKQFIPKAESIDSEITKRVQEKEVEVKVEMLERHADAGKKMIGWALEYLAENLDKIRPNSAIRMLVDGIEIERKSRGLPTLLAEINKTSDEALMEQIQSLMNTGSLPELEGGSEEENKDIE